MDNYPEHEKVKALKGKNDTVAHFLEWLSEQGIVLARRHQHTACYAEDGALPECEYATDELEPVNIGIEDLLAQHFDIDRKRLSAEKDAMVEALMLQSRTQGAT